MKTYEKFWQAKYITQVFQPDVIDLLTKLITADLTRLGNLINGPADIRNHPWFLEVVWEKLLAKDIETPMNHQSQLGLVIRHCLTIIQKNN